MRYLFLLGCSTDTQDDAQVQTVDDGRCTTSTDEWQWLSCNRSQTYCYCHVEECLGNQHDGEAHAEKGREIVLTPVGYSASSEQEDDNVL